MSENLFEAVLMVALLVFLDDAMVNRAMTGAKTRGAADLVK